MHEHEPSSKHSGPSPRASPPHPQAGDRGFRRDLRPRVERDLLPARVRKRSRAQQECSGAFRGYREHVDVEAEHDRLETQHDHVVGLFGNVHFRFLGNEIVWFLGNVVGLAIVRLVLARDDRYQPAVMTAAIVTQSGENETP